MPMIAAVWLNSRERLFAAFYFFYFSTLGVIVPYWGLYLQGKGFTLTEIGLLMAVIAISKLATPYLWASLADRHGVRRKGGAAMVLRFITGAAFVSFLLLAVPDSFLNMLLAMSLFCLFWNACLPQLEAATLSHIDGAAARYGKIRLWGSLGFMVATLGVGVLIDRFNTRVIFFAGAALLFCFLLISLRHAANASRESPLLSGEPGSIGSMLNPVALWFFFFCFVMQLSHAPYYTFFSIYLSELGFDKTGIGLLWVLGVVAEIFIFIIATRILRRFSLMHLLAFVLMLASLRWLGIAWYAENLGVLIVMQILHAFTYGLFHCICMQWIDAHFKGQFRNRGQALYSTIGFGLGGGLGSAASGYLWAAVGGSNVFLIVAVIAGLASVSAFMVASSGVLSKNN